MHQVDLNADLGEGTGNDEAILDFVTSANIACGFHAGDPRVMARTVALAKQKGVAIGAHPGFHDREGFGRRAAAISPEEVHALVVYQVGALSGFARAAGVDMQHVKPHGALYNAAAVDPALADAIAGAVAAVDLRLILFGLAGSELIVAGERAGLRTANEAFADRTYRSDGTLMPRSDAAAVITEHDVAVAQALRLVIDGKVTSVEGADVELDVDTICIHGDAPHAPQLARAIRAGLETAGIEVRSLAP